MIYNRLMEADVGMGREALEAITSMGFNPSSAEAALKASSGVVEQAVELLLRDAAQGGSFSGSGNVPRAPPVIDVSRNMFNPTGDQEDEFYAALNADLDPNSSLEAPPMTPRSPEQGLFQHAGGGFWAQNDVSRRQWRRH